MVVLPKSEQVEADRTGFGALGPQPVADRLVGILGHEALKLGLGALVLRMGILGSSVDCRKLRPRIGARHIDYPHGFDAWLWRLNAEQARGLTALHTAPELALSRNDQMLVEWVRMSGDLNPLAAPGDDRQHGRPGRHDPHVVLKLG